MSDGESNDSGIPEWQRGAAQSDSDSASDSASDSVDADTAPKPTEDALDIARRFLNDDEVQSASREKKEAFLKAKGIEDGDIQKLLDETADSSPSTSPEPSNDTTTSQHTVSSSDSSSASYSTIPPPPSNSPPPPPSDRAPIVTYPEFLTPQDKPAQPPLVTTTGILTTLQVTAALSALLVGTSRFVLSPMLDSLTEARLDLHSATTDRLAGLVAKLEDSVSEIPTTAGKAHAADGYDSDGSDSDPTEMFHRDVGTQTTSFLPTESTPSKQPTVAADAQADSLKTLTRSLADIRDGYRSQSDDLADVKTLVDVFRDELDALTYPAAGELSVGFDLYSRGSSTYGKTEPEDQIRKVRDNIRRVKGALLSTKSFPGSVR
jgi:hypothetical protein